VAHVLIAVGPLIQDAADIRPKRLNGATVDERADSDQLNPKVARLETAGWMLLRSSAIPPQLTRNSLRKVDEIVRFQIAEKRVVICEWWKKLYWRAGPFRKEFVCGTQ